MEQVTYHFIEKEQDVGQRLDNYLMKTLKGVPKSRIYRIIRAGEVRVNKKRVKPDTRLQAQDMVRIPPVRVSDNTSSTPSLPSHLKKQLLECIIYEDDALLVINKPAGIAVHGGSGVSFGVIEAYRQIKSELSYLELVHRLDKDTSGCLLLAKKSSVLKKLQAQWQANQVQKMYWAICENTWVGKQQTTVTAKLQKNILKSGERMVSVHPQGKTAISHVHLLQNAADCCWVKVFIDTGRTHQIRVHCAYLGHAVLGDEKYGKTPVHQKMPRLFLHAYQIKFEYLGKMQTFVAPVDEIFQEKIHSLG
jgi:23S rRNA pseudouridine955/2504/2580 synthase